ncbi:hypothetical protein HMPREF9946_03325 [Acetobacteraceae bacterium AT-5844]|nr:hypothetical protein HMPREF9946_03325 [Acetobacteraceae bacterium AT-5844]
MGDGWQRPGCAYLRIDGGRKPLSRAFPSDPPQGRYKNWCCSPSGTVAGQRIRENTGTTDRSIAEQYRATREAELHRGAIFGPPAVKNWEEAVDAYTAEQPPLPARPSSTPADEHFGRKLLKDIGQEAVNEALCGSAGHAQAEGGRRLVVGNARRALHESGSGRPSSRYLISMVRRRPDGNQAQSSLLTVPIICLKLNS